jgi:DNA-binding IclR family transcriptional regulator
MGQGTRLPSKDGVSTPSDMARASQRRGTGSGSARTYSAPALEKGFDVIELLATAPDGLTISEMATRLGRSISEIFRMIIVMERRFWLSKDPATDRYRVTYKVLDLAFRATPTQELTHVAAPVMYAFSQRSQQSCHLVVQYGARALVVLRQESPRQVGIIVRLGTEVELAPSCSGHVLLAFKEPRQLEDIIGELSFPRGHGEKELRTAINRVRKQGYETTPSARVAGVHDISYPVFGFDGDVVAALTCPFVTFIDGSQTSDMDTVREMLAQAALEISQGLGWASRGGEDIAV